MKVSVVICTYNGEQFITEQLDSLRYQSRVADEVLIADDKSTDGTVHIIQSYIKKYNLYESWKLYINEKNKGYADNFHDVMMKAKGDVIFFSDQDDIWYSDKIERMMEKMERTPEIQLLGTEFAPFYSSKDAVRYVKKAKNDSVMQKVELNQKTIFIDYGCEGCVICVRRNFLCEIDKYWFSGFAHDEFVWKMALCYRGCYRWNVCLMDRRFHGNNTSKQKLHDKQKRILFLERLLKSHLALRMCAEDKNVSEEDKKLIAKNIQSVQERLNVLKNRNIYSWFKCLVLYARCYQSFKSLFMELYIAFFR